MKLNHSKIGANIPFWSSAGDCLCKILEVEGVDSRIMLTYEVSNLKKSTTYGTFYNPLHILDSKIQNGFRGTK